MHLSTEVDVWEVGTVYSGSQSPFVVQNDAASLWGCAKPSTSPFLS